MNKYIVFSISFYFICAFTEAAMAAGEMSSTHYGNSSSFTNAQGTSSSADSKYKNVLELGLLTADSTSLHYKDNAGLFASQLSVTDNNISFFNEFPAEGSWQLTPSVTAQISVQNIGGNTIVQAQYRISNTGPQWPSASYGWQNCSFSAVSSSITLCSVYVPYISGGQSFQQGQNNYIQWQVFTNGLAQTPSSVYQVNVRVNDAPAITITQPDIKTEYTSLTPEIAASVTVQYGAVDAKSLRIIINNASGANVATITSLAVPSIFNATTGILSYKYAGPQLTANTVYTLTISAADTLGKTSVSDPLKFIPKSGTIADLVPYPSPFNPKIQPVVIRYVLENRANVWINMYDMSRRIIKRVVEAQPRGPGVCEDQWNGTNFGGEQLANGVYFCEVIARNEDGEARRYTSLAIFAK